MKALAVLAIVTAHLCSAAPALGGSWTATLSSGDGLRGRAVLQAPDGGFFIAGGRYTRDPEHCDPCAPPDYDFYLAKTDGAGTVEWERSYPSEGYALAHAMDRTADGGFIIAGDWTGGAGYDETRPYFIKTDPAGNPEWDLSLMSYQGRIRSVQQTADGGYIAGAYIMFTALPGGSGMVKIDSSGAMEWDAFPCQTVVSVEGKGKKDPTTYTYSRAPAVVRQTDDGGYVVTGDVHIQTGPPWAVTSSEREMFLAKTDALGGVEWERIFGEPGLTEHALAVRQTADGGFIVAGTDGGALLIRTDRDGNLLWQGSYGPEGAVGMGYAARETTDGGFALSGYAYRDARHEGYLLRTDEQGNVKWERTYPSPEGGELKLVDVLETADGAVAAVGFFAESLRFFQDFILTLWNYPEPPTGSAYLAYHHPPDAVDDAAAVARGATVLIDVLANDRDPDLDPLFVSAVTDGANGTVTTDGALVSYTPGKRFKGSDVFTYTVDDGNGEHSTARVTVLEEGGGGGGGKGRNQ